MTSNLQDGRHWEAPTTDLKTVVWRGGFAERRGVALDGRQDFTNLVPRHSLFLKRNPGRCEAAVVIGDGKPHLRSARHGDLTVVPAGLPLIGHTVGRERYDYAAIFIDPAVTVHCLTEIGTAGSASAFDADFRGEACVRSTSLVAISDRIARECESPETGHALYLELLGAQLAIELVRSCRRANVAPDTGEAVIDRRLQRALDLMHKRMDADLGLDELAAAAGYSYHHFAHVFKSAMGVAPYAYLTGLRMAHACRCLRGSTRPIKAIAASVGYGSVAKFTEAFRKHVGTTPARFRAETR